MKKYLIASTIILSTLIALAGNGGSSKIYDSKRQLIADTAFSITKAHLKKFILIEDSLSKNILDSSIYEEIFRENRIGYDAIISFLLDEHGNFTNIKLEKYISHNEKIELNPEAKPFKKMVTDALKKNNGRYSAQGFKACKNKTEKYYLAFRFTVDEMEIKKLQNGWLVFHREKIKSGGKPIIQQ